jgi:hypothetical protein
MAKKPEPFELSAQVRAVLPPSSLETFCLSHSSENHGGCMSPILNSSQQHLVYWSGSTDICLECEILIFLEFETMSVQRLMPSSG